MKQSEGHLRDLPPATAAISSIPAPVQATTVVPPPKPAAKTETYSVIVDRVPAQQLLFALARDAKLNIDVHPGITGTVTLNAIDQTLPQILNRISKQVDMRYEFDGPNLVVMPDSPFLRTYKIDYVNMNRVTEGNVSVSGNILGTTVGSSASGNSSSTSVSTTDSNASSVSVKNSAANRFWQTLEANIQALLRETDKIIANPPQVVAPTPTTIATQGQVTVAANAPTITYREAASVIIHPETGIVTVRATSRQHEKIQEFLDNVSVSSKRQVLIEATIVEVQLSRNYQQGIDWNYVGRTSGGLSFSQTTPAFEAPSTSLGTAFNLAYTASALTASIKLLENFGNVRVLSSPRISVVNNQTALLKVVDNIVYFNVTATTNTNESSSVTNFTTTANTVPVGFIMNVTPQISQDDQVLLNIKPTISRVIRFIPDPNPVLKNPCGPEFPCPNQAISNDFPQIQTREMESLLRVRNGDIAVMGGLIQDQVSSTEDSLPGVNRVPILKELFASKDQSSNKTELVIFLRPVVIKDPGLNGDYRDYRAFLPPENFLSQESPPKPAPLGQSVQQ
ncbi:MAG TPA: pilus (MSHA type) biogenesis protein MshL [Burkholderiales bacterium]|nr:pilus (MSHA type) biogenesis protein MshL [Burkholderiales bacterium]